MILHKDILTSDQLEYILANYRASLKVNNSIDNRIRSSFEIPEQFLKDWENKLCFYIPIRFIYKNAQIIEYKFGGIKEHSDAQYMIDGINSTYTFMIYLKDCDDGYTSILKPIFRIIDENSKNKTHERISIKPKAGRCIVFNSDLYHLAEDTYEGKIILHTRIF